MARRHAIDPRQPALVEVEPPPSPMPELIRGDRRIAFGRVVMPYFFGLDAANYSDITPEMVDAANPNNFLPYLLPDRSQRGNYVVDGVALSSEEYTRIVRSPETFTASISNKTHEANRLNPRIGWRNAKALRSAYHALEHRLPQMARTLDGVKSEQAVIDDLNRKARMPGYAHDRAVDLRNKVAFVREVTFKRILEVMGREKNWTDEQADYATRTVDYRLFFTGAKRVGNWQRMLRVAHLYGEQRARLFGDRIEKISEAAGRLAARLESFDSDRDLDESSP